MNNSELRDKNDEELMEFENQLRDQLVRLSVAKATQRATNTAQFARIRRDIARVLTHKRERELGLHAAQAGVASAPAGEG